MTSDRRSYGDVHFHYFRHFVPDLDGGHTVASRGERALPCQRTEPIRRASCLASNGDHGFPRQSGRRRRISPPVWSSCSKRRGGIESLEFVLDVLFKRRHQIGPAERIIQFASDIGVYVRHGAPELLDGDLSGPQLIELWLKSLQNRGGSPAGKPNK